MGTGVFTSDTKLMRQKRLQPDKEAKSTYERFFPGTLSQSFRYLIVRVNVSFVRLIEPVLGQLGCIKGCLRSCLQLHPCACSIPGQVR